MFAPPVSSSWPVSAYASRRRSIASDGDTYSTDATPGIARISSVSSRRSENEVPSARRAVTATLLSMKASPALRPLMTMKRAASRTSMSTTVAVAARLIIALRQKPCQARTIVKPMKRRNPIGQYSRS